MDERVFRAKVGSPMPAWDAAHRLPLTGNVGPEIADSGTVFRVNSTFMDVSDQTHMIRQWYAGGALFACVMAVLFSYGAIVILFTHPPRRPDVWATAATAVFVLSLLFFFGVAIRLGRDEFFWLTRRPIRFNRGAQKIYAIRHRRYRNAAVAGDICWEIPWDERSVFCVHRGPAKLDLGEHFHIRCYQLDEKDNVLRAFAVGREWQGIDGMRDLLAQWNYWCAYMNNGPEGLPPPLLYLAEYEDVGESFLCCLYELGLKLGPAIRAIFSPFAAALTSPRLISMWTCRDPVWPKGVLEVSAVRTGDAHAQPIGGTPVGWAETARARAAGRYPLAPHCISVEWSGEADPIINAQRWMGTNERN